MIFLVSGVLVIIKIWSIDFLQKINSSNAWLLVACSIWMIIISGIMSYVIHIFRYDAQANFNLWFNGIIPQTTSAFLIVVGVGMVKNIVFGFLDNAGLFFGAN